MKERDPGDWGASHTRGASTLAWARRVLARPCAPTGGRGEYLRGYSRRVRWLAAWAAVAAWGRMVVISAWGCGEYTRGRGETAAHPEGPRPLRVYLRGVFPGKHWRGRGVPLRVPVGGARALSYGYRRRR